MGGTTLVSNGYLGPIEGDVVLREIELPLEVDAQVSDMSVVTVDEIIADATLPDEIIADAVLTEELEVILNVPCLDVEARLEYAPEKYFELVQDVEIVKGKKRFEDF